MKLLSDYKQLQLEYRFHANKMDWNIENWLFTSQDGSVMNINNPYTKFHRLIKKYNKTVTENERLPLIPFHALRHTNASLLVRSNIVDAKTISRKLGHSNISTTMNYYVHAYDEEEARTAAVLDQMLLS